MWRSAALVSIVAMLLSACSPEEAIPSTTTTTSVVTTTSTTVEPEPKAMSLESGAFADGALIPTRHTCDGADLNPPLSVVDIPDGAVALMILVEDPDAPLGTWIHWVEFDVPVVGDSMVIEEGANGLGISGHNSWNLPGYGGPCPPEGETHEYVFTILALGTTLDLPEGVDAETVITEASGKALAEAVLTGSYSR